MNKTLGQKRVGVDFNPTQNKLVQNLKETFAKLIDDLENEKSKGTHQQKLDSEKIRALSIAQTKIEEASMFAVKALFL